MHLQSLFVSFKLSFEPTSAPTFEPTSAPVEWYSAPTFEPTSAPVEWYSAPTFEPTSAPVEWYSAPTFGPTSAPTQCTCTCTSDHPSSVPTSIPTSEPTAAPTSIPTSEPTAVPSSIPTSEPTAVPTSIPTSVPTATPTSIPSPPPTSLPSSLPTSLPSLQPTSIPTPPPTAPHTGYTGVASPGSFPIISPYLGINFVIALTGIYPARGNRRLSEINATTLADGQKYSHRRLGTDTFLGEIMAFGGNFAPTGYALCQGQILGLAQNTALFSLLGTQYGGTGTSTFALPDLRGRVTVSAGQGAGLSPYVTGETTGVETQTLAVPNLPSHLHSLPAGGNTKLTGADVPLSLIQPTLTINYIISLFGIYPSQNRRLHESSPSDVHASKFYVQGGTPYVGEIAMFAGDFAPVNWAFCDGQTLQIADYETLYNLIGKTYVCHMYNIRYCPCIKCLFLALYLYLSYTCRYDIWR